jgi:microcystin-dependent protein
MSEQYIGEIRLFPYNRGAPEGWFACDGTLVSISEYDALYSLIGTTYGGNGVTTFGLPDLRGRVPLGSGTLVGSPNIVGQVVGQETVTLTTLQMPVHGHPVMASTNVGTVADPTGQVFAAGPAGAQFYTAPATPVPVAMASNMLGVAGGSQPHDNCAPTLAIQACIAWNGIYPSRP